MTMELRVLDAGQWDGWYGKFERAFGGVEDASEERALWRELTECERSLAAMDADDIVGTAGAFSFRLSLPGGALVPAAGVTMVSVQPTHRRRGVLTAMMRRQLDDVRALGEPLAVLTASEPAIYGRFGYGNATEQMRLEIDTTRVRLRLPAGTERVRLRIVPPEAGREACEAVYAQRVAGRPGMIARQPGWDRQPLLDPESQRHGAGPLLCVLAEVDGEVRGYARYAVTARWSPAGPDGSVALRDVEALDPVTYAALWSYLFDLDLTSRLTTYNRPADDPLLHLVSDVRRCGIGMRDSLHVRLVELGAALEARTYATPVDVVFDVEDAFCPWNEGRWRLTGDHKGASCVRTGDAADLALSVRELGSVYLGGFSLSALAGAGRVTELRPGALAEASPAFGSDVKPWLPHGF
ncbi:GNAT family N-acetyltransferase [Streptomyces sp. H10-C2]|uniref:GNAT family N-acetyltransferase n=1 Tax=unclassified Streptomyces TaxID=2593676 RepID=UPI0024BB0ABC|nr:MULTISPECIES: GNAT family N-acetyltransferase [unclassified Streptomyces]MDJ0340119.1 GNAT family N-acetyltransferase [Streptomyces sp. PH10-H1]MDJ0369244.1 GNAT family N-acetyltransferase [Streptomyces sp. H10-C2]